MRPWTIGLSLTALLLMSLPLVISAQSTSNSFALVSGTWRGQWIDHFGYVYHAEMHLGASENGAVQGEITWTLQKSPQEKEQSKLNLTGVEIVRGTYDPVSRVLSLDGVAKTDPNSILGLDKYRLILADTDSVLGGITWDHGSWGGLISLVR